MPQVFACSTQPRQLLDEQISNRTGKPQQKLGLGPLELFHSPRSRKPAVLCPPSLFPPQPPSAPRISPGHQSKLVMLAKGGVWSAVMLWRIPTTTTPGSFCRRTATLSFWTQIDAWIQECFGKTFVDSEEKPAQGRGEQPEPRGEEKTEGSPAQHLLSLVRLVLVA